MKIFKTKMDNYIVNTENGKSIICRKIPERYEIIKLQYLYSEDEMTQVVNQKECHNVITMAGIR